jgi:hypothetical protein
MHGDFSRWFPAIPKNQVGILAQEGRILLDADVNAHSLLTMRWQDLAGRAAFGAGIAAIPADAPDSWKVVSATASGSDISINVMPGIAWADGLLVELDAPRGPVTLPATPLEPPIQVKPQNVGGAGTRDAVVLEVWRRSLNGFQEPSELIEPALGGPDTAERIETAFALRLYRMADGDDCRTIISKLRDDLKKHGTLRATLAPVTTTSGDCPVVQGGGYSGFEHDLYRIEIADTDRGDPAFKWSQWNGGLVGSGKYDAPTKKLTLRGNEQAIRYSGLTTCYVEVLDKKIDGWHVVYGVRAVLDAEAGQIDMSATKTFGALPSSTSLVVRVWNDLRLVSEFPMGTAKELRDGIRLEFDATRPLVPGDYWTFPVRAGELENAATLVDNSPPFGIHHHRVPLAELHWNQGTATIEDCRVPLHPITANDGCCTFSVGDNITSHGNFTKINDAIAALPQKGGRVCVLPGEYLEAVKVLGKQNVEIVGCGPRSRIMAPGPGGESFDGAEPSISVVRSSGVRIDNLEIQSGPGGIGILVESTEKLEVTNCHLISQVGSCIEVRSGRDITIADNLVQVIDGPNEWAALTLLVQTARIERNRVEIINQVDKEVRALGGIWLRSGSRNVDVIDNHVIGGLAHGIMLGNAEEAADTSAHVVWALNVNRARFPGYIFNKLFDPTCIGCGPGTGTIPPIGPATPTGPGWVAGDPLRGIRITRNRIEAMGMSAIGVFGFFSDPRQGVISVYNLEIEGNHIAGNLRRKVADVPDDLADLSGYAAISLADCHDLAIRDNAIESNGTQSNGAVCGIYVLSGGGIEISRNKVVNNGPTAPLHLASTAPHGGIFLGYVTNPASARIAAAVRDNEVLSPHGPALVVGAYGHVQVIGNVLGSTSPQGYRNTHSVMIEHYGFSWGLNTDLATVSGLVAGRMVRRPETTEVRVSGRVIDDRALRADEIRNASVTIRPGVIRFRPVGSVMFAQNHVELAFDGEVGATVTIVGIGDVDVTGNTFASSMKWTTSIPVDITGGTLRVTDNRFAETPAIMYSAKATGSYMIGTGNISDHCVMFTGSSRAVSINNIEINGGHCARLVDLPSSFGFFVENNQ